MAGDSIVWLVIILSILICDGIAVYLYRKKRFPELGFNRVEEQADLFTKDNQMAVEVGKELIPQMDGDLLFYFTYLPTGSIQHLQQKPNGQPINYGKILTQ